MSNPNPAADPLFDEKPAADYLNSSPRTLQRWRQTGTGPRYCKLGKNVKYRRSWLDEFIEQQSRTSTSAA
jgi:hypothetical protein